MRRLTPFIGSLGRGARTGLALAAVVSLAATATVLGLTSSGDAAPSVTVRRPPLVAVPVGFRLVGLGHVGVLVPAAWRDEALHCGTPVEDTVIVEPPLITLTCLMMTPPGVESVRVSLARPLGELAPDRLDGVAVLRRATGCRLSQTPQCSGALWVPSEGVGIEVESTTSEQAVDDVLDRVRMVPDAVGVPSLNAVREELQRGDSFLQQREVERRAVTEYRRRVVAAGLRLVVLGSAGPTDELATLNVVPHPGTMLRPGGEVTVTWSGRGWAAG